MNVIGTLNDSDEIRVWRNAKLAFSAPRHELQAVWSEVSYQIALRRDDGACVQEEFESLKDASAPGLSVSFSFDIPTRSAPGILSGARPKIAVLREQGVNGHVEMAVAFERAGFTAVDVHMSPVAVFHTAMCWVQGRVGQNRSCSMIFCVTNSQTFSRAPTASRLGFAMVAR